MAWRPHGRAEVDPDRPQAFGICDRCNFQYNRATLKWQFDVQGKGLQNRNILVCPTCMDEPAWFLRAITLPPDPVPVWQPRPEQNGSPPTNFALNPFDRSQIAGPSGKQFTIAPEDE